MVKTYLALSMLFGGLTALQAQTSVLEISKRTGESTTVSLQDFDKITFSKGDFIIRHESGDSETFKIGDIRMLTFVGTTGVEETKLLEKVPGFYPNPVSDYIRFENITEEKLDITVYSVTGSVFLRKQGADAAQPLDVRELPNGVYLLKVNQHTLKFTKQ